jgi:hypothetical protein
MLLFWFFVLCLWSDQSEFMAVSYGFNLWGVPGVVLSLVVVLNFSTAVFLFLPLDLAWSQAHILAS